MNMYKIPVEETIIEDKPTPKYVVPTSNFGRDWGNAMIMSIPCKVIGEKLSVVHKNSLSGNIEVEHAITVISCVSGVAYTIPLNWTRGFDSLEEANASATIKGVENPSINDLIGRNYCPHDNSYIRNFNADYNCLYNCKCKILSIPFKDKTRDGRTFNFILVEHDGGIYRTLWEEWCLYR